MEAEFLDYERNRKWGEIFNNIHSMAERFSTLESAKLENKLLNRYLDVVPYDKTRVKLMHNNLNYINASYVSVQAANRKYILTQGPLKNTISHFWLMVWEQQTKVILMLNNLIERGHIKCHQYWPNGKENDDVDELIFEDVSLTVKITYSIKLEYYVFRKFELTDHNSNQSREVFHFHYTHWPDFDLPKSSDSFLEFLFAVRQSNSLNADLFGPAVIHCSAGIGRSGTFALVDSCLVMIEKNKCLDSINVIDILLEMRKYRMGLIQTPGQLRFSFQTIIEGSKKIRLFNPDPQPTNLRSIARSLAIDEEALEGDDETTSEKLVLDDVIKQETELRNRKKEREERRQKMQDTIDRIKRKQKEVEERLKFNQKLYRYLTPAVCLGVAICVGVFAFTRRGDSGLLVNLD